MEARLRSDVVVTVDNRDPCSTERRSSAMFIRVVEPSASKSYSHQMSPG